MESKIIFNKLETPRLLLRKIIETDIDIMYHLFSEHEIMRYTGVPLIKEKNEILAFINKNEAQYKNGEKITWGIELKTTKKMIGYIGLFYINNAHAYASLGALLIKEYWNKGITTEAKKAIINFAFTKTFLNRIESQYYEKHIAIDKTNEKSGMKKEALLRENFLMEGKFRNSIMCSIIKSDFQKNKDFYNFSKNYK